MDDFKPSPSSTRFQSPDSPAGPARSLSEMIGRKKISCLEGSPDHDGGKCQQTSHPSLAGTSFPLQHQRRHSSALVVQNCNSRQVHVPPERRISASHVALSGSRSIRAVESVSSGDDCQDLVPAAIINEEIQRSDVPGSIEPGYNNVLPRSQHLLSANDYLPQSAPSTITSFPTLPPTPHSALSPNQPDFNFQHTRPSTRSRFPSEEFLPPPGHAFGSQFPSTSVFTSEMPAQYMVNLHQSTDPIHSSAEDFKPTFIEPRSPKGNFFKTEE